MRTTDAWISRATRRSSIWVAGLSALALAAGCSAKSGAAGPPAPLPPPGVHVTALQSCPVSAVAGGTTAAGARSLPDLLLPCLGAVGLPVRLRSLTGLPTVVNLWASYCGPCRDELPAMQRLADRAVGKVRVLGVDSSDEAAAAAGIIADLHLHFPMVFDYKGKLLRGLIADGEHVLTALPVTAFVRADGTIAKLYQGGALTDSTLRSLVQVAFGVSS